MTLKLLQMTSYSLVTNTMIVTQISFGSLMILGFNGTMFKTQKTFELLAELSSTCSYQFRNIDKNSQKLMIIIKSKDNPVSH